MAEEETKTEEAKTEDAKAEDAKADDNKAEDAKADEMKVDDTKAEEPKKEGPSEDTVKAVAERLKFFFSDANLRQDFFMRKQILKTDGAFKECIPVETLLRFNTIKQHTTDPAVVLQAAKTLSDVLTVVDDKALGRVEPFTMDKMDDNIPLSLHVSNLPLSDEDKKYACTTEEVRQLFEKYGKIALVKFLFEKNKDGSGKKYSKHAAGAAFVEFETEAELQKAAKVVLPQGDKTEPETTIKLGDNTLVIRPLKDYVAERKAAKKKREESEKDAGKDGDDASADSPSKKRPVEVEEFKLEWKPGCVIRLKGLPETCDREAILAALSKGMDKSIPEIKSLSIYVDFSRGQEDGAIRFKEPSDAVAEIATKLNSGDLEIGDSKVKSATVLTGDEESKYWADFIAFKNKQIQHRAEEKSSRKKRRFRK